MSARKRKSQRTRTSQPRFHGFETLESREMLSASPTARLVEHVLIIDGTSGADQIEMQEQGNTFSLKNISIVANGTVISSVAADQIWAIDFSPHGGSDVLNLIARDSSVGSHPLAIPIKVEAASGPTTVNVDFLDTHFTAAEAAGKPGLVLPSGVTLTHLKTLLTAGTETSLQAGSYLRATVTAQFDAAGTGATLTFSNVQVNLGQLIGDMHVSLNSQIKPLADLARQLTGSISGLPDWTKDIGLDKVTPIDVLQLTGHEAEASAIEKFASAVTSLEQLSTALGANGWVTVTNGSVTAHLAADGSMSAIIGNLNAVDGLLKQIGVDASSLNGAGISLPFLQQPSQLLKFLMGQNVDLISYTLPDLKVTALSVELPLADFPTPIPGGDIQVSLHTDVSVSAGATVVFNSSGLQSGNLSKGFSLQNKHLTASFNVGLSGTYWEFFVIGYRVTGKMGFQVQDFGSMQPTKDVAHAVVSPFADPETFKQFLQTLKNKLAINNGAGNGPGSQYVMDVNIAQGLFETWNTDPGTIAKVLFTDLKQPLGTVARALYDGLGHDLGKVAYGLSHSGISGINGNDYLQIALQLKGIVGNDYPQIVAAMFNNCSGIYLYNIASALRQLNVSYDQIASAIYNLPGRTLDSVAYALWNGGFNSTEVVFALKGLTSDIPKIVQAAWNNCSGIYLYNIAYALRQLNVGYDKIASAIYNLPGRTLDSVAYALWNGGFNSTQVVFALKGLTSDIPKIVQAAWNNCSGIYLYNIASALRQLNVGYDKIASAIYNLPGRTLDSAAYALWNGGFNSTQVIFALKGLTSDIPKIVQAAWNNCSGIYLYNIASALRQLNVGYDKIASAIYNLPGRTLDSVAYALWNGGFDLVAVASALKSINDSPTTVAKALWRNCSGIDLGNVVYALTHSFSITSVKAWAIAYSL